MIKLTSDNFKQEVTEYKGKVLVDFFATWCGPCKMLSPVLEKLSEEVEEIKFASVNVDEEVALAMAFKVSAIPTVILFENGVAVEKFMGYRDEDAVKEFLGL